MKIAATAADGLPLTGPNSAESSLRARTNPKSSGWDLWFQAEEQRILLEKYEGEQLVKRFAIPHAGAKFYEIV